MAIHFVNNWDIGWGALLGTALALILISVLFYIFVRILKNRHQEVLIAKVLKFHVELSETPTDKKVIELITENDKLRGKLKSNAQFNGIGLLLLLLILWVQKNEKKNIHA